jgi:hypothetical protein
MAGESTKRDRCGRAFDYLLIVLAICSAAWVGYRVPGSSMLYRPYQLASGEQATASDVTIYVDEVNRIHVGSKLLYSDAELAGHLSERPGRVLLLVHPDSLFENVMRTVEVLRSIGAESIQLGTTRRSA